MHLYSHMHSYAYARAHARTHARMHTCTQNVYGIDLPTAKELVAHDRDEAGVAVAIGCDWMVYQVHTSLGRARSIAMGRGTCR